MEALKEILHFEDTYAKRLSAAEADIVQLRTTDLSAVNSRIDVLDSNWCQYQKSSFRSSGHRRSAEHPPDVSVRSH